MRMLAALALSVLLSACGGEERTYITLASTTSTKNSGLFDSMLPKFTADTGVEVRVVAVGTGQAIRIAERGDADVLLVHHRPSEDRFVAEGYGVERRDVMYNDFVLVGPKADPAGIRGMKSAAEALRRIASTRAPFVSRGDDSGTHKKELALWGDGAKALEEASGTWYREAGAGMGATINVAVGMQAYTLADRATWMSFRNRGDLEILCEGDQRLFNPYGVIAVDPKRHPHVNLEGANAFVEWLTSAPGREAIESFRIDGQQVFFLSGKP